MTTEAYDTATGLLSDIDNLNQSLTRVQTGIRVVAQAEDQGQFLDIAALQGELETAIQDAIDEKEDEFQNL